MTYAKWDIPAYVQCLTLDFLRNVILALPELGSYNGRVLVAAAAATAAV